MKLNELFADDDAVSPVIGVILMVAITVILAAVIGTFVLGLGSQIETTEPQSTFTFEENNDDSITVTHDGGQPVDAENVEVVASDGDAGTCDWETSEITAGDDCDTDSLSSQEGTLRVTWESDDGSQVGTLQKYPYDFTG